MVEGLKEIKKRNKFTLQKLGELLNIDKSTLSRYFNLEVFPKKSQKEKIIDLFSRFNFNASSVVENYLVKMKTDSGKKIVSLTNLLTKPEKLMLITYLFYRENKWMDDVDLILTVETEGIPFATIIGLLLNKPIAYFRKIRSLTWKEYIRVDLIREDIVTTEPIFINKEVLENTEKLLIVDDVVRSGETIRKIHYEMSKQGFKTTGIIVLTSMVKKLEFDKKPIHGFNPIYVVEF